MGARVDGINEALEEPSAPSFDARTQPGRVLLEPHHAGPRSRTSSPGVLENKALLLMSLSAYAFCYNSLSRAQHQHPGETYRETDTDPVLSLKQPWRLQLSCHDGCQVTTRCSDIPRSRQGQGPSWMTPEPGARGVTPAAPATGDHTTALS